MFSQNRTVYFNKRGAEPDYTVVDSDLKAGVTMDNAVAAAVGKHGSETVKINGVVVNIPERIAEIRQKLESVGVGMSTKVKLADLPKGTQGLAKDGFALLDLDTMLTHPDLVDYIFAHEGAHLGFFALTKNRPVHNEALADLVAERITGKNIESEYDEASEALQEIAKIIDREGGEGASDKMILDYYVDDKLSLLLQYLIEISAKQARMFGKKRAISRALRLFGKVFPECQIMQSKKANPTVVKEEVQGEVGDIVDIVGGEAANDDGDEVSMAS